MTYQPGQLAMVTAANRRDEYRAFFDGRTWRELDGHTYCVDAPTTIRPLVVLDPSDPTVEHFVSQWRTVRPHGVDGVAADVARMIEKQTRPAIEEPKGLGAVVEGRKDNKWVRTNESAGFPWRKVGAVDRVTNWAGIDAYHPVRVLSEGVPS